MRVLVVYETFYGNTEQVANAVGAAIKDALTSGDDVLVRKVADTNPGDVEGLGLLVVGAPTRAFGPTPGVKQWLKTLPAGAVRGVKVAAFDTRILPGDVNSAVFRAMARLFGWAAEKIARQLVARGGIQAAPPAGFGVVASEGPLKAGELDRAKNWAREVCLGL